MKRVVAGFFIGIPLVLTLILVPLTCLGAVTHANVPTVGASAQAGEDIPPVALAAYQQAAPLCPGLSWTVLAGIGKIETGHGSANGHHLDDSGQAQPPGLHSNVLNGPLGFAYGPMQFLAGTWATYGPQVAPGANQGDMEAGPVQNVHFAAKAAALLLCSAAGGTIADDLSLHRAIDAYSGSTDGYYDSVTEMARLYAAPPPATGGGTSAGGGIRIVLAATHFVGLDYANGNPAKGDPDIQYSGHPGGNWVVSHFNGNTRYNTLDCSGLVNAAMYLAYGLDLNYCSSNYATDPRFRHVSMGELQPGDLVLYGQCGLGVPGHIAIVAAYDPTTGLASTIDAARHGTVVGFRAQQSVTTWKFTTAVRYIG
jgi:cell wall-associated NlpC family hydrolase